MVGIGRKEDGCDLLVLDSTCASVNGGAPEKVTPIVFLDGSAIDTTILLNRLGQEITDPVVAVDECDCVSCCEEASLRVTKEKLTPGQVFVEGNVIQWQITTMNDGEETVTGITVSDPTADSVTNSGPFDLAPGASQVSIASYTVTAADVAAGFVVNTATANGLDEGGDAVTGSASSTCIISDASITNLQIIDLGC